MKLVNFGFLFFILLFIWNLKQIESQQQGRRRGRYVAGRNNMPVYLDGQIPKTEKVKTQERQRFQTLQNEVEKDTIYKDYLFTVQEVQEFLINLPVTQQVVVSIVSYHIFDGAYITPNSIDDELPIKVYVYENGNRLIHQSDFYFQNFILFNGQQFSTYAIRFENQGSEKLLAMSMKKLIQSTHVDGLIDKNVAENHALKTNTLLKDLKFLFDAFERYTLINFQSVKILLKGINLYFYWNMIQTFFTVFVCIVQIFSIRKVCNSSFLII